MDRDEGHPRKMRPETTGRVTHFRAERTGCNFKRTFCNQADESQRKEGSYISRFILCNQAFVKGRKLFVDQAPRFNGDVSAFFGANTEVAILNELLATRRTKKRVFFLGAPPPPPRKRLSSRDQSCLSIKHHDSTGRVSLFDANTQVAILNELLATRCMKMGSFFWRPPPPNPGYF